MGESLVRIQNNITAVNTHRQLGLNTSKQAKSMEKLSSGYRVNRAADDAAGLAISEKMRAQIRGLSQASRNIQDGISLIQVAESGMQGITDMLHRQRELIIQALNDTNVSLDRAAIQLELDQLTKEIDATAHQTEFNGVNLLNVPRDESVGGGGIVVRDARDIIRDSYNTITDLLNGSVIQLQSLNDEYPVIGHSNVEANRDLAARVEVQLLRGYNAWNDIRTKVVDIVYKLGDDAFDPFILSIWDAVLVGQSPSGGNLQQRHDWAFYFLGLRDTMIDDYGLTGELGSAFHAINGSGYTFPPALGANPLMVIATGHYQLAYHAWLLLDGIEIEEVEETTKIPPGDALWIQKGANLGQGVFLPRFDLRASTLGIDTIYAEPRDLASQSMIAIDDAINKVSLLRAAAGAMQNRLEYARLNVDNTHENTSAAESRIRDADMAKEMTEFTKDSILTQASTAMLAQANALPQGVLQLLG